jgi:hypothetical protein
MQIVLPVDASCEDLEEDGSLNFLSNYVAQAAAKGAPPYSPPVKDEDEFIDDSANNANNLKYSAYAAPEKPTTVATTPLTAPDPSIGGGLGAPQPMHAAKKANAIGGALGAAQGPWGAPPVKAPEPTPAPAPTVAASQPTPQVVATNTPPPVTEPVAPEPRELTDREKEAAMLFGGGGAAAETTSRRTSRRTNPSKAAGSQPPPQQAMNVTSTPVVQQQAPPAPVYEDLLGFDVPVTTTAPATTPAPDIFSSMADLSMTSSQPANDLMGGTPPAPPSQNQDPFMMAGLGTSSTSTFNPLSPLVMTTPAFGSKWMGLVNTETRVTVPIAPACQTPEAFGKLASERAGFHVIEIIGSTMEVILSGSSPTGTLVCLHAKILAGSSSATFTVRSSDKQLSQSLCDFFTKEVLQ